uniref:Potassium channel tetramerisation-type BTB domain-containing protein n=1 Tax=Aceria tosichella TaxID=561515 RepID=A0A6G1S894_9ACAR
MEPTQEQYIQFDLGERIFLCSLKTLQKYPNSTLANCLKHSDSTEKGTTISLECDSKYFQWILDYMRDGRLDKMDSLSRHEVRQLSKEAKFFCLDELVELCELRVKTHFMGHGCLEPKVITSRLELDEILDEDKKTGGFTVLLNVGKVDRVNIAELIELGPSHNFRLLSCHGLITGYQSEFYKAGKLIKCSEDPEDFLSYVYYAFKGVFL